LIDLRFVNASDAEIRLFTPPGPNKLCLNVKDANGSDAELRDDRPRWTSPPGHMELIRVRAGSDAVVTDTLNRYVHIKRPGTYTVSVRAGFMNSSMGGGAGRAVGPSRRTLSVDEETQVTVLPPDSEALRGAVERILQAIPQEKDSRQRVALGAALASVEDPVVIPTLLQALRTCDSWAAVQVARGLARFDDERASAALLNVLRSGDPSVQKAVVEAVALRTDDPEFGAAIEGCLTHRDYLVRLAAVRALSGSSRPAVWRRFAELLRDPSVFVRMLVAEALSKTGDATVVGDLQIALSKETNGAVRDTVKASLEALGHPPKPLPNDAASLTTMLSSPHEEERRAAARRLAELNTPAARAGLAHAVSGPCATTRFDAITHVKRLKVKEAVPSLMKLLDDGDSVTRIRSAVALARIGHKEAVHAIAKQLTDPAPHVRRAIPGALGSLGDPAAIPALEGAIAVEKDERALRNMRGALAHLRRIQGKRVRPNETGEP